MEGDFRSGFTEAEMELPLHPERTPPAMTTATNTAIGRKPPLHVPILQLSVR
jgi:hypothetical protein